jgi:hypothetical protein
MTAAVILSLDVSYVADGDPCAKSTSWSVFQSANSNLNLAGVLAGFLIAVVAALVVQWYDRASPRLIALFASGVPPLTLGSYLFTILAGANQSPDLKPFEHQCNQVWSQWLPAFAMLLIGGSVLLCGLGWALVIYSDNLAAKMAQQNFTAERIRENQRFFTNLSAWLSLGGTTGVAALLMVANVVYLKATVNPTKPHVPVIGCAMFFVFLFGIYVMVRSLFLVVTHAISFREPDPDVAPGARIAHLRRIVENERRICTAKELGIFVAVIAGAFAACKLTALSDDRFPRGNTLGIVLAVAVLYLPVRYLGYATSLKSAGPTAKTRIAASITTPDQSVDLTHSGVRLAATSYNVILFSILGTIFSVALTQGPLWDTGRSGVTLFIGGVYPASILVGLSHSVAASSRIKLPGWKELPVLRLLP